MTTLRCGSYWALRGVAGFQPVALGSEGYVRRILIVTACTLQVLDGDSIEARAAVSSACSRCPDFTGFRRACQRFRAGFCAPTYERRNATKQCALSYPSALHGELRSHVGNVPLCL
jgi:hypothetical protein